jgi:hypothetical protein
MHSSSEPPREDLDLALCEANLLGLEVRRESRNGAATLAVLSLPTEGPQPEDRRVQLVFRSIGRVAASLRLGDWDDERAPVQPFELAELLPTVQSFDGLPVYGELFDVADREISKYSDRLSFDLELTPEGRSRSLRLFQEGVERHLDVWIWFDELVVRDPKGVVIPTDEFVAGARRWWEAFAKKDPRTEGYGMYPYEP